MKKLIFVVVLLASLFIFPGNGVVLTSANDDAPPDLPASRLIYPPTIESKQAAYQNLSPEMDPGQQVQMGGIDQIENRPTGTNRPGAVDSAENYVACVWQSYATGNSEILKMDPCPYGTITQLTSNGSSDITPRINRGATKIVFVAKRDGNYEIYTMDINGENVTRLTNSAADDFRPDWSPDGNKIIFVSEQSGEAEIYTINADGSGFRRITNNPAPDFDPTWSPDGTQIAWIRAVNNTDGVIIKSNIDGTGQIAVSGPLHYVQDLIWSPLGTHLGFTYDPDYNNWWNVGSIRADGSGLQNWDAGAANLDVVMGGWSPKQTGLLVNLIHWGIYYGEWYIDRASVEFLFGELLRPAMFDFYPHLQTTDYLTPESWMIPLPEYSRASGVPISVEGVDYGRAGLGQIEAYWRNDLGATWTRITQIDVNIRSTIFKGGTAGQTTYFYSQATDRADNQEAQPVTGYDTFTKLFFRIVQGKIGDIRGAPIPGAEIPGSPELMNNGLSDGQGAFMRYLSSGSVSIDPHKPAYGNLPPAALNGAQDVDQDYWWALPPVENQVIDGGFETEGILAEWDITPAMVMTTTAMSHTGEQSVWMGNRISTTTEALPDSGSIFNGLLCPGLDGDLHLFAARRIGSLDLNLYHEYRSAAGTWSSPELISTQNDGLSIQEVACENSPDRTLHVAWTDGIPQGTSYYRYANKPSGGSWSTTEEVFSTVNWGDVHPYEFLDLALDGFGNIHMLARLDHLVRTSTGWSAPTRPKDKVSSNAKFGVDPAGTVHLIYRADNQQIGRYIAHSIYSLEEGWSNPERVLDFANWYSVNYFGIDKNGGMQFISLLEGQDARLIFFYKAPGGDWTQKVIVNGLAYSSKASLDRQGNMHLVWYLNGKRYYTVRHLDGTWLNTKILEGIPPLSMNSIASTLDNPIEILFAPQLVRINHYDQPNISMTTTVTLPAGSHEPTLSFASWLEAGPETGDVQVWISNTQVLTLTGDMNGWQHHWVDLSNWDGKTFNIRFEAIQSDLSQPFDYYLDEVVVGEWLTPRVTGIAPGAVDRGEAFTMTIFGENFIEPPLVFFDDLQAPAVTWVDEHTLSISQPAGLPAGSYTVRVVNPGGQEGWAPEVLKVIQRIFLPTVLR